MVGLVVGWPGDIVVVWWWHGSVVVVGNVAKFLSPKTGGEGG